MFKVNNRNTRTRCEICSKLTIKIPEQNVFSARKYQLLRVFEAQLNDFFYSKAKSFSVKEIFLYLKPFQQLQRF